MLPNQIRTKLLAPQQANQLATMLKAVGQPLRIQLIAIIIQKRLVSVSTLLHCLPGVDPFLMYSNLRYLHKKQLIKKLKKGRVVYYGLSKNAIATRFDVLFSINLPHEGNLLRKD